MKITENILAQLNNTDTLLDSLYQAIAEVDPDYLQETENYQMALSSLFAAVPEADTYLQAQRQELASDIRFALWQGFMWNLDCFRNPVNKLLAQLDFEDLCRENQMHVLPAARAAQTAARTFIQSLSEDKLPFLDPISDHFAYLQTYGYKLAYAAGIEMASKLLPQVVLGFSNSI